MEGDPSFIGAAEHWSHLCQFASQERSLANDDKAHSQGYAPQWDKKKQKKRKSKKTKRKSGRGRIARKRERRRQKKEKQKEQIAED